MVFPVLDHQGDGETGNGILMEECVSCCGSWHRVTRGRPRLKQQALRGWPHCRPLRGLSHGALAPILDDRWTGMPYGHAAWREALLSVECLGRALNAHVACFAE